MELNDLHPPDDYSHRFFIWHEWIQANGPLTNDNVFDYFATSMFYDKQSNNQVLRMQTMHTGIPLVNEAEELKRFTGIEFALVHSQPPSLFIIQKRERLSPDDVRPLETYFVMNNRIYQSPDIYTLISNRLLTSIHSLQASLNILRTNRPAYTPRSGFVWPIAEPAPADDDKKRGSEENTQSEVDGANLPGGPTKRQLTTTPGVAKKRQNNMLMLNAMRTTAVHASNSFSVPTAISDSAVPDTPATVTNPRSSATPAPASQRAVTPRAPSIAPTPQEPVPVKGPPGAGKKKKKRTSIAPPAE